MILLLAQMEAKQWEHKLSSGSRAREREVLSLTVLAEYGSL